MNNNSILLSHITKEDVGKVGGKAANLATLSSAGFSVPPGLVVPVSSYEQFLKNANLKEKILNLLETIDFTNESSVESRPIEIKELITANTLEGTVSKDIDKALGQLDKNAFWAVRSSAVAEDLPEASFAGQQDSFLNIPRDEVSEYVKRCWASYWNKRAFIYRHNAGIPHLKGGIAVIVQKMINAQSSGVMFTTDPVNTKKNTIIIESSWGLGESIVSGIVSPDRFFCDKKTGKIIEKNISKKDQGIFLSNGEKIVTDIEESKQDSPSLTIDEAQKLAQIGKQIESHFGSPQDIEWSIENGEIYILQSRPITTLTTHEEILWTRAYGDEYWADVTSPLFYSLLGEYLTKYVNREGSEIMGYKELTGKELLKIHKGHIYFNSEVLEEVFTYNPKFSRTKELLNYFPEKDHERIANAKTKIFRRLRAEIRIMLIDPDGMIMRTDKAYRKWASRFVSEMKSFDELDLAKLNEDELYREFKNMEQAYLKHYRLIRYGMVTHSIGTNLIIKRWLSSWLDDKQGVLYAKLISGLPDNKTIQTNIAISRLAQAARDDSKTLQILQDKKPHEFLEELKKNSDLKSFSYKFHDFLDNYGHRSHTREIYFPRWADDPSLVITILQTLASSPGMDFSNVEKEKIKERETAEKEILGNISTLKNGFFKKLLFKTVLNYAQIYLVFRENQRFYLDHQLYRLRRLFMEFGRRFVESGTIEQQEDIFFLTKEEIAQIANREITIEKNVIKQRKQEFIRYENKLPPKFLKGKVEFDDTVVHDGDSLKIIGTPSSPGIATGFVRVIKSVDDFSKIRDDDILVTSNTDPGWTPVFSKLAGLITETGGILSHGAVVSREYGIPAVTAVKNATTLFKTGQKVTIDGNDGVIYIKEKEK